MTSHALVRMVGIVGLIWVALTAVASIVLITSTPGGDIAVHWWRFVLVVLVPPTVLVAIAIVLTRLLEPVTVPHFPGDERRRSVQSRP